MVRLIVAAALLVGAAAAHGARIAVDVGHYLAQAGATSARGTTEFEFNRRLALELAGSLKNAGHEVMTIGDDGLASDLGQRSPRARGMDLFISIHHDSVQRRFLEPWEHEGVQRYFSDRFSGYSIFVSRENPRLAVSLACASAIGAAMRSAGFTPSLYHADPVLGENRTFADKVNGVHYFDRLAVLRTASIPALLFEAGVIVNRDEEMRMHDPAVRTAMVGAMTTAISECLAGRR